MDSSDMSTLQIDTTLQIYIRDLLPYASMQQPSRHPLPYNLTGCHRHHMPRPTSSGTCDERHTPMARVQHQEGNHGLFRHVNIANCHQRPLVYASMQQPSRHPLPYNLTCYHRQHMPRPTCCGYISSYGPAIRLCIDHVKKNLGPDNTPLSHSTIHHLLEIPKRRLPIKW
jgi:hypothetical protein